MGKPRKQLNNMPLADDVIDYMIDDEINDDKASCEWRFIKLEQKTLDNINRQLNLKLSEPDLKRIIKFQTEISDLSHYAECIRLDDEIKQICGDKIVPKFCRYSGEYFRDILNDDDIFKYFYYKFSLTNSYTSRMLNRVKAAQKKYHHGDAKYERYSRYLSRAELINVTFEGDDKLSNSGKQLLLLCNIDYKQHSIKECFSKLRDCLIIINNYYLCALQADWKIPRIF